MNKTTKELLRAFKQYQLTCVGEGSFNGFINWLERQHWEEVMKLNEILEQVTEYYYNHGADINGSDPEIDESEAREAISQAVDEIIGEDEDTTLVKDSQGFNVCVTCGHQEDCPCDTRNQLRAEQRKRKEEFIG